MNAEQRQSEYYENSSVIQQFPPMELDSSTLESLSESLNTVIDTFDLREHMNAGKSVYAEYKGRRGPSFRIQSCEKDEAERDILIIQAGKQMQIKYGLSEKSIKEVTVHNFDEGYKKALKDWVAPGVFNSLKYMWDNDNLSWKISKKNSNDI